MTRNRSRPGTSPLTSLLAAGIAALSLAACSKTVVVAVPPRVDLKEFSTIGVVRFQADGGPSAANELTHRFLATIQAAQPGTRLLELGPEAEVLAAVRSSALDLAAVKAVGAQFGVDALLTGRLEASEAKPRLSVAPDLKALSAGASVNGSLQARLQETRTGATVWTNGAHGTWNLASLHLNGQGAPWSVHAAQPDGVHEAMLDELVEVATRDFRPRRETRKVQE